MVQKSKEGWGHPVSAHSYPKQRPISLIARLTGCELLLFAIGYSEEDALNKYRRGFSLHL